MKFVKMKETETADKQRNRRQTLDRLSSGSGLLLFLLCFIALIHHQLRIQENHRLILDSSELFNKLETEIFRKIQQNDMITLPMYTKVVEKNNGFFITKCDNC